MCTAFFRQHIWGESLSLLDWDVTRRNSVILIIEACLSFCVLLVVESRAFYKEVFVIQRKSIHWVMVWLQWFGVSEEVLSVWRLKWEEREKTNYLTDDSDVLAERKFVCDWVTGHSTSRFEVESEDNEVGTAADTSFHCCPLVIHDLHKYYLIGGACCRENCYKRAVRGLSLACPEGERFGLLGINGAGKTTTLGVLTHEIFSTAGEVFIGGKSLNDPATQRMIGYCPQVDPLLDLMNAYETLWFFGRIRGIDRALLEKRVQALVDETGLGPHAHRPCGTYSGGNRRKLSLAVALIGDPKVLLLDEVLCAFNCLLRV
jgi:ABC-type Na+ transport system ATPase subunit NatA